MYLIAILVMILNLNHLVFVNLLALLLRNKIHAIGIYYQAFVFLGRIKDEAVLKPSAHEQIFCGSFLSQRYSLVYKDSKCCVENSFHYAPEMTMDSREKNGRSHCQPLNMWQIFCDGSCTRMNFGI